MSDAIWERLKPHTHAQVRIRPWKQEDEQKVIDLINLVFKEFDWRLFTQRGGIDEHLHYADRYYAQKDGYFMVVERQEEGKVPEIIGTLAYYRNERDRSTVTFDYFFMHPKYQGRGYILPLMQWGAKEMKRQKIRHVEAWSNIERPKAHKLYRHLGFKQDGTTHWTTGAEPNFQQYFFQMDVESSIFSRPPYKV